MGKKRTEKHQLRDRSSSLHTNAKRGGLAHRNMPEMSIMARLPDLFSRGSLAVSWRRGDKHDQAAPSAKAKQILL